jgi:hypothetical protein
VISRRHSRHDPYWLEPAAPLWPFTSQLVRRILSSVSENVSKSEWAWLPGAEEERKHERNQAGCDDKSSPTLDLGTSWRWVVTFRLTADGSFYPRMLPRARTVSQEIKDVQPALPIPTIPIDSRVSVTMVATAVQKDLLAIDQNGTTVAYCT